jgi:hypothetical protein
MHRILRRFPHVLVTAAAIASAIVLALPAHASADSSRVKQLNIVLLHGASSSAADMQPLQDGITDQLSEYVAEWKKANPGFKVQLNVLNRSYPNMVDTATWGRNIADTVNKRFPNLDNLILIGHSMGGKSAIYAVSHNLSGIGDRTSLVITINSPIRDLNSYYITGGGKVMDYYKTNFFMSDQGLVTSVASYDSSADGLAVSKQHRWLALISASTAPTSTIFSYVSGIDPAPRDMDDGLVPFTAQYADGADVIYYGVHKHGEVTSLQDVADLVAGNILDYVFGKEVQLSNFVDGGKFSHNADWLLGNDSWTNTVGEWSGNSSVIKHTNTSFTKWQTWEDTIGERNPNIPRSSFSVKRTSLPVLSGVIEARWLNPNDPSDARIYVKTRAAPRSTVSAQAGIYLVRFLPPGMLRSYSEVRISGGTPLTDITSVKWTSMDPRDLRITISSTAQSPFRWFTAEWRVYGTITVKRDIIGSIPSQPEGALLETASVY